MITALIWPRICTMMRQLLHWSSGKYPTALKPHTHLTSPSSAPLSDTDDTAVLARAMDAAAAGGGGLAVQAVFQVN
jgi:hypothetical protein